MQFRLCFRRGRRPAVRRESGEKEPEGGADADVAGHLNPAVVLFHNAADRGQTQASALAGFFGGEE